MRPVALAKKTARVTLEALSSIRPRHWDALRVSARQWLGTPVLVAPRMDHLTAAVDWLKRAQDVTGTDGVAWGYRARAHIRSQERVGWEAPYPETTGYIIETLLRYSHLAQDSDSRERARRMANWEVKIQLADGGIQGGTYGTQPAASSTFVTGQVVFGFVRAYEEFGDPAYLQAGRRAGNFLLSCLDEKGRFVSGYSHFCTPGAKAYEARTGWALAELGRITRDPTYTEAADRIAQFAVSCQQPNGWFRENDLDDHTRPLTHCIGYALEGLLGIAALLKKNSYTEAVYVSLASIEKLVEKNGFLAGRWTADWRPAVTWCCLTGSSQLATVYLRAHRIRPSSRLRNTAQRLLSFVTSTQIRQGIHPSLIGGVYGSYPFGGAYGRWCVLNWATKFYADAVMDWFSPADRKLAFSG